MDFNTSENIKERIVSTVLRNELLKKNKFGNGTFEPKKLKIEKVKEVLLSLRFQTWKYSFLCYIKVKEYYKI